MASSKGISGVLISTAMKLLLRPGWAAGENAVDQYEQLFSQTILKDVTLPGLAFGRGRVALWTILRALGSSDGAEVILPAYTCETVPMAVKYAGAKCLYVDVGEGRFNAPPEFYEPAISDRTRALICQHTYGIPQPIQRFVALTRGSRLALIEDCCHAIQIPPPGATGGLQGDAAFFSTHHSKPYSTGRGGVAVFQSPVLRASAKAIRDDFSRPMGCLGAISFSFQILLYGLAVRPTTRTLAGSIYRWAQRAGLIRGSIPREEYGKSMPSGYLTKAANCQAALGMKALRGWAKNVRHRRMLTEFYLESLTRLGVDVTPLRAGQGDPVLLFVPIRVENKREILRIAMAKGLSVGTWFDRIPAHIHAGSASLYDYSPGQCLRTEQLIAQEVHFLTAPGISLGQAERAVRVIGRHARLVDG